MLIYEILLAFYLPSLYYKRDLVVEQRNNERIKNCYSLYYLVILRMILDFEILSSIKLLKSECSDVLILDIILRY